MSEDYRLQNAALHRDKPSYGAGGRRLAKEIIALANRKGCKSILDYGCGKATLSMAMPGWDVRNYDPAIPEYNSSPIPADLVVCLDVLEHVEPDCLDAVLDHVRGLMKSLGLFVIATRPARKRLPDGRNAHLIVESADWWRSKIEKVFKVLRSEEDCGVGEVCFEVAP